MANIAFIGMGIMGCPMAGHLLSAGHSLRIHSRTKARGNSLMSRGAKWSDSPAAAADGAELVFICVTDTPDVEAVIKGPAGIMDKCHAGQIIVDHSTISPAMTRSLAQELLARNVHLLDAPVSGGDIGARSATLSMMVGGDENAFERAAPLLRHTAKSIAYCGPSGSGQLTKATNQILVGGTLLAVCEALIFAVKNDLNVATTLEALSSGAAGSWQLSNLGPKIAAGDFRPGFMIDLIQKDLRIVLESAEHSGMSLLGTSLVHQLMTAAQAAGHGKQGTQALYTVLKTLASVH